MANGGWWAGCGTEVCKLWPVVGEAAVAAEVVVAVAAAVAAAVVVAVRLLPLKAFVDDVDII